MTTTDWANETAKWKTAADWSAGVPTISTDAVFNFAAAYTVTLNSAAQANSLLFDAAGATLLETATGSLAAPNGMTIEAGTIVLHGGNALLATTISGGTLEIANMNALGFGPMQVSGGLVANIGNIDLTNQLTIDGSSEFAAANGTTFAIGRTGTGEVIGATGNTTITFGDINHTGTILWFGPSVVDTTKGGLNFAIDGGTLKEGNSSAAGLPGLLASSVFVQDGATLDTAGFSTALNNLIGLGTITGTAGTTLTLSGSTSFAGTIAGGLSLDVKAAVLTGANTYTGTTTVTSGELQLGYGGIDGTIPGLGTITLAAGSVLSIDHSNAITIANAISGAGEVMQSGTGTTLLSNAGNSYSGATQISAGVFEVKNSAALGHSSLIEIEGGTLLAGGNVVLPAILDLVHTVSVAAVTGRTLSTNTTSGWAAIDVTSDTLNFGTTADTGTVLWNTPGAASNYNFSGSTLAVHINGGTLKAGDDNFYFLTDRDINGAVTGTTIGAHGTLDAAGHGMAITTLLGSGIIENSGAATTLNVGGGNFSGQINGALTPFVSGAITLTGGLGNFTAGVSLLSGTTLTLHGISAHNYIFENHNGNTTTIVLGADAKETGTATGFDSIDVLDFRGIDPATVQTSFAFDTVHTAGVTVKLTDGTHTQSIHLAGDYTGPDTWSTNTDGHGGTTLMVGGPGLSTHPIAIPQHAAPLVDAEPAHAPALWGDLAHGFFV